MKYLDIDGCKEGWFVVATDNVMLCPSDSLFVGS